MKKSSAATTHIVSELGPAAAAVAVQRRLSTATMLNRTRSRRVRTRGSSTRGAIACVVSEMVLISSSPWTRSKSGTATAHHGDTENHGGCTDRVIRDLDS